MPRNVEPGFPVQDEDSYNLGDKVILDDTIPATVTGKDSDGNIQLSEQNTNIVWLDPDNNNVKKDRR